MPGSVIAIAVMSSPEQMPGSQRAFCSSVQSVRKYGRQMSLWSVQPEPGGVDAGPLDLLGDHEVVAEVVDAAAAVLLGHGHAEEPERAGLREHLAVDDAGRLPLVVVGDELVGDERPHGARGTGRARRRTGCAASATTRSLRTDGYAARQHEGELGAAGLRGWPTGDGAPPTQEPEPGNAGGGNRQMATRSSTTVVVVTGGDPLDGGRRSPPCPAGALVVAADSGVDRAHGPRAARSTSPSATSTRSPPAGSAARRDGGADGRAPPRGQGRHRPRAGPRRGAGRSGPSGSSCSAATAGASTTSWPTRSCSRRPRSPASRSSPRWAPPASPSCGSRGELARPRRRPRHAAARSTARPRRRHRGPAVPAARRGPARPARTRGVSNELVGAHRRRHPPRGHPPRRPARPRRHPPPEDTP